MSKSTDLSSIGKQIPTVTLPHDEGYEGTESKISNVLSAAYENTLLLLGGQNQLTASGGVDLKSIKDAVDNIKVLVTENNTILKDLQSKI